MLSHHLFRAPPRRLFRRAPLLLACFAYRYDAHLVPDLLQNLEPVVHGWVALDDRGGALPVSDEAERRRQVLQHARSLGAGWVLLADPDERFETAMAARVPELLQAAPGTVWTFDVREMWSAERYRIDGPWGRKRVGRLFALAPGQRFAEGTHSVAYPQHPAPTLRHSGFNLYHLKMITAERRVARRDLYRHLDPEGRLQPVGYDYLADETDAEFEAIPPGRGYRPEHREDGGLWMATVAPAVPPAGP